jgi:putative endonuclease
MSNFTNSTIYIGLTNDLFRRVLEHKSLSDRRRFTFQYKCTKLVYFEEFHSIEEAITREKQMKNWKREWKNNLINSMNPNWDDLAKDWK